MMFMRLPWANDALLRKSRFGHIECLPTHAESGGHIGYRLPVNLTPPQHLVAHLHQIAGIKELIAFEEFVLHLFRVWVKGSMLTEDVGLCIDGTVGYICFCLLHDCQLYYVLTCMDVKPKT